MVSTRLSSAGSRSVGFPLQGFYGGGYSSSGLGLRLFMRVI